MTRSELLQLVLAHARSNGFEFRRWYVTRLGLEWQSPRDAVTRLESHRRYYALLFSHEFARAFWKAGDAMSLSVPNQIFQRRGADGTIQTVTRKAYIRRRMREHAWQYHLKQMAVCEEPLRYVRRFLRVEEELVLPEESFALGENTDFVIVDEEDLLPEED